jgi:UDP-N-acetylmuramoylalanine--D-glutamate ligase
VSTAIPKDRSRADGTAPWPLGPLGLAARSGRPRVGVLGLARSGLGAARLLLGRSCQVDLCDLRLPEEGRGAILACQDLGATLRIGPHDPSWLDQYDLLVKSPGVPAEIPFLVEARRRGLPVIGELELGFLAARGPVLAITGTNGKSTTTAWAGDILREAGLRAQVVGNIGRAFCDGVIEDDSSIFVVEVSSFQLQDVRTFRPRVAVLLNFTPDHLDRHGTLQAYLEAKLALFREQGEDDLALIGPDEELAFRVRPSIRARWARFALRDPGVAGGFVRDGHLWLRRKGEETRLLPVDRVSLPGPHNLENALAAAAATAELGAEADAMVRSLSSFAGLPHRLERVGTIHGIRFVNDSKATNTDSLAVALRAFPEPVVLIAGGRDKEQDFRPLGPLVRERVALLILIGEAAENLERQWNGLSVVRADSLKDAVAIGVRRARPGQVVLLSPACASFDMFRNYEDRGDQFRDLVRRWVDQEGGEEA